MLTNYWTIALRILQRNSVFSLINIIGLVLGITCTILITMWVRDEMNFDKFNANGDRLYRVMANTYWGDLATFNVVPANLNETLKKEIPGVARVATLGDDEILLSSGDKAFKEKGFYATDDFLSMFSFPLLKGKAETALGSPTSIVITESLASKYFGDKDPIGQTLTVDKAATYQITGVVATPPSNSSLQFSWLIPFQVYEARNAWLKNWGNYSTFMFAELEEKADLAAVNEKLRSILKEKANSKDEIFLYPYSELYLRGDFKDGKQSGGRIEYVKLFSLIALFVLLIACINFTNLTTARYTKRIKEIGIRKVSGAGRNALVLQFLGEAVLLTGIAVVISLVLTELILPVFNLMTGKSLSLQYTDPLFIAAMAGLTFFTGLLAGSYPALFLSGFQPVAVLKTATLKRSGAATLRKGLVVFQFCLAITLIVGTIVVFQQIEFIRSKNLGFDKESLMAIPLNADLYAKMESFQDQLNRAPGIISSTSSGDIPIDISGTSADLSWPGKDPDQSSSISATWVGYDYLKTLGISLVAGRDFSRLASDSNAYIVNESAVEMMNLTDPVGTRVSFWNGEGEIIGVVKDFHLHSLREPITPLIFVLQPGNGNVVLVRTEQGKTQEAMSSVEQVFRQFSPGYPAEIHFMDDLYQQRYQSEMIIGRLVTVFAVMAILISVMGLFGLATFTSEQRRKEIGVRKILGSSVVSLITLLSKDYLKLVGIAFIIVIPFAYYLMDQWLAQFAYRISISWWIFAATGVISVGVAILTISIQTLKAATANPTSSLRNE